MLLWLALLMVAAPARAAVTATVVDRPTRPWQRIEVRFDGSLSKDYIVYLARDGGPSFHKYVDTAAEVSGSFTAAWPCSTLAIGGTWEVYMKKSSGQLLATTGEIVLSFNSQWSVTVLNPTITMYETDLVLKIVRPSCAMTYTDRIDIDGFGFSKNVVVPTTAGTTWQTNLGNQLFSSIDTFTVKYDIYDQSAFIGGFYHTADQTTFTVTYGDYVLAISGSKCGSGITVTYNVPSGHPTKDVISLYQQGSAWLSDNPDALIRVPAGGSGSVTFDCDAVTSAGTWCAAYHLEGTYARGNKPCTTAAYAQWSSWSSWSTCTHTCGTLGQKKRTRTCDDPENHCFESWKDTDWTRCYLDPCPQAAYISEFPDSDITVNVGERLTIVCRATGVPIPAVTLKKGLTTVHTGLGVAYMDVSNAYSSHGGTYKCEAENILNTQAAVKTVDVNVCTVSCSSGFYLSGSCSGMTSPQCLNCAKCNTGSLYLKTSCQANGVVTQPSVCGTCSDCQGGEYMVKDCREGGASQPRVCDPCATCTGETYQQVACRSGSITQNTVCAACDACQSNEFQVKGCREGAVTQPRVCQQCDVCQGETYQTTACRAESVTQNTVCAGCAKCSATQYQVKDCREGSVTQRRVCAACSSCSGDTYQTVACRTNAVTQDTQCAACNNCPSGTYVSIDCREGSDVQNRVCEPCAMNEQSTVKNSPKCTCNPGYERDANTNSCTPCKRNFYKGYLGDQSCTPCPTGEITAAEGSSTSTDCFATTTTTTTTPDAAATTTSKTTTTATTATTATKATTATTTRTTVTTRTTATTKTTASSGGPTTAGSTPAVTPGTGTATASPTTLEITPQPTSANPDGTTPTTPVAPSTGATTTTTTAGAGTPTDGPATTHDSKPTTPPVGTSATTPAADTTPDSIGTTPSAQGTTKPQTLAEPSKPEASSSSDNTAVIAGAAAGTVVLIIGIIAAALVCWSPKRRQVTKFPGFEDSVTGMYTNPTYQVVAAPHHLSPMPGPVTYEVPVEGEEAYGTVGNYEAPAVTGVVYDFGDDSNGVLPGSAEDGPMYDRADGGGSDASAMYSLPLVAASAGAGEANSGERLPQYEQPVPQYEHPVPQYEQPVPQYEQPVPQYEQPVPQTYLIPGREGGGADGKPDNGASLVTYEYGSVQPAHPNIACAPNPPAVTYEYGSVEPNPQRIELQIASHYAEPASTEFPAGDYAGLKHTHQTYAVPLDSSLTGESETG